MTAAKYDTDTTVLEPELPIIDPHHHLRIVPGEHYLMDDYRADVESGHNVRATVFIECGAMFRRRGPEHLRCLGEAEFVAGVAAMSESGLFGSVRMCEAFVGNADFMLGERIDEVLEALAIHSGGRLRGIRGVANWDADPSVNTGTRPFGPKSMLLDSKFRAGFARLAAHKLVFDSWAYYPQLPEVCDLADTFPNTTIIVDHCGGLLGIGPYTDKTAHFPRWKELIVDVARRPNVVMKLGGLSAPRTGFGFEKRHGQATAEELVRLWKPYIETCIEQFGPSRCMFESNFPPDGASASFRVLWNAFKMMAAGYSASEKADMFAETARRTYSMMSEKEAAAV